MHGLWGIFVIPLTLFVRTGKCEVYTSVAEMKDVILLEVGLVEALEKYIQLETQKLNSLVRYIDKVKQENNKALRNSDGYVENPINAYLLIKRLMVDWQQVELLMSLNNREIVEANITSYKAHPKFPTAEDLDGTITALIRLQETYNLDTALMARGELAGEKYSSELSASDCFEIGKRCYKHSNFYYSYSWLVEADARIMRNTEGHDKISERSLILEYMAVSVHRLGSVQLALKIINKLLHILPNHAEAVRKKIQYEKEAQEKNMTTGDLKYQMDLYQNICNGALTPPIEFYSKLKCKYEDNNNPFLLLAPFKVEELSIEPKIVLFHEVMSDKEIEKLKELSHSRFGRAQVIASGSHVPSLARIGKVAWFWGFEDKYVETVNRRVGHMTGLSNKTAEPLQVSNYGVGGHFLPHYDFAPDLSDKAIMERKSGNRIATVLFYMSDVFQGGGTIFLVPKLNVKPKKGSAVFWYNLHPNGNGDITTAHGSCPVLIGSKWVANKWLYEYGQEFLRPCE